MISPLLRTSYVCRRKPSANDISILEQIVHNCVNDQHIQANIEYYSTNDPDPNDPSEKAYAERMSNLEDMLSEMKADDNYLKKRLGGLSQSQLDVDGILSKSWESLAQLVSRNLSFLCGNQVVLYDDGAILEKDKSDVSSVILPNVGFVHNMQVCLTDRQNIQLTVSWSDTCPMEEVEGVIVALIQLAIARQSHLILEGSETPPVVQVDFAAIRNKPAAIVVSPDQFPQLTKLSKCNADELVIKFEKTVFSAEQLRSLLTTAGHIALSECVFADGGESIVESLKSLEEDMTLWKLSLDGNFPFGTKEALDILAANCSKMIVVGGGAAADLFERKSLVARLEEVAAKDGLFYSWSFEYGDFAPDEKELFREFLAAIFTRKLQLQNDRAKFAAAKAEVIRRLSEAYDQDVPDGETYDWPWDLVEILPRSHNQEELASFVKEKIESLVFSECQPPAPHAPVPSVDGTVESLGDMFARLDREKQEREGTKAQRSCPYCLAKVDIDAKKCKLCGCTCKDGTCMLCEHDIVEEEVSYMMLL